jgi:hypothetical protein
MGILIMLIFLPPTLFRQELQCGALIISNLLLTHSIKTDYNEYNEI